MSTALAILACIWVGCGVVAAITDRDYGRAACMGRDINGWAVMLFVGPPLFVCVAPYLLWCIAKRALTTFSTKGAGDE